jgi:TolB-like protein/DNA-binding SARP family transcriptional activator
MGFCLVSALLHHMDRFAPGARLRAERSTDTRFTAQAWRAYNSELFLRSSAPSMPDLQRHAEELPLLSATLFGAFSLAYGDHPISLTNRKAKAFLGCIVASGRWQVSRAEITALLWSEVSEERAAGAMRTTLWEIQRALRAVGFNAFEAGRHVIALDPKALRVDLMDVLVEAEAGRVHPLLVERKQVVTTLLDGLDHLDPALGNWLIEKRAAYQERLINTLARHLPPEAQQDLRPIAPEAEAIATAMISVDPAQELAVRCYMRARAKAGEIGAALHAYTMLWQHLEREYDIRPAAETQDLVAKLRMEQPDSEVTPESLGSTGHPTLANPLSQPASGYEARPSIAVLPFRTLGPPEENYFGEGVVDNIINALAGLKDLFVISRGSTIQYKSGDLDFRQIGRAIGVRYVLTGKAQRAGDQLRITTELIECETAAVLKPKRYEGQLSDLFKLQDEIALDTTQFIAPYVRERELRRAMRKHPSSMTAYDLVLQALGPLHDLDRLTYPLAKELLEKALSTDPYYAPAYTFLSFWHCYNIGQEWSVDHHADAGAAQLMAKSALRLDSNDPSALALFGHTQAFVHRDYHSAINHLDRALASGPSSALAWTFSAASRTYIGDTQTAIEHALMGLRLSPLDVLAYFSHSILSQAYFVHGDFANAVTFGRLSFSRNARLTSNLRILAASCVEIGELAEARSLVEQHCLVAPTFSLSEWLIRTPLGLRARETVAAGLRTAGMT